MAGPATGEVPVENDPKPTYYLQLTRLQAGLLLCGAGHDTQYIVPALFTHIPKYVPLGCLFQLHESSARASATETVKAAKQNAAPIKISRMMSPFQS